MKIFNIQSFITMSLVHIQGKKIHIDTNGHHVLFEEDLDQYIKCLNREANVFENVESEEAFIQDMRWLDAGQAWTYANGCCKGLSAGEVGVRLGEICDKFGARL